MKNKLKRPELMRQYFEDLEYQGPGKYYGDEFNYQGKPYTGFVIYDYWQNGNIMNESEHVDGQTMGWDVEYYENGVLKRESLMWGGTSVVFRKFDENGDMTDEGWVAPKEYYNEVAKLTGIEPIDL